MTLFTIALDAWQGVSWQAGLLLCGNEEKSSTFPSCPILRHMLKYKKAYINTIEIAKSIIQILFHLEHDISVSIYAFHLPINQKSRRGTAVDFVAMVLLPHTRRTCL